MRNVGIVQFPRPFRVLFNSLFPGSVWFRAGTPPQQKLLPDDNNGRGYENDGVCPTDNSYEQGECETSRDLASDDVQNSDGKQNRKRCNNAARERFVYAQHRLLFYLRGFALQGFSEIAYCRPQSFANIPDPVCSENEHHDDHDYQKFLPADQAHSPTPRNHRTCLVCSRKNARQSRCPASQLSVIFCRGFPRIIPCSNIFRKSGLSTGGGSIIDNSESDRKSHWSSCQENVGRLAASLFASSGRPR